MRQSKRKSFFYHKIFVIPLILFCVYTSGYALSTVYNYHILIEACLAYLFLFPIVKIHFKEKLYLYTISFILFLFMIIVTFVITGMADYITYLTLMFKVIIAFGIASLYKFEDFIKIFKYTMVLVSIISLIGYFIVNGDSISIDFPVVENSNDVPYAVGYLFFYITSIPERNMGIFWEPGLFATFLILALVFEVAFKKKKPNPLVLALLVATVITTNSSAGYGLLMFIPGLIIVKYSVAIKEAYLRFIIAGGSLLIALLTIFNYSNIFEMLGLSENPTVQKILSDQIGDQYRLLAVNHNFSLFTERPVFGLGFAEAYARVDYVSDTSTSTFLLAVFGMVGAIYTILWVVGILSYRIQVNKSINILILILFLMILNKEPHLNILSTWCILFFLLKPGSKRLVAQAAMTRFVQNIRNHPDTGRPEDMR